MRPNGAVQIRGSGPVAGTGSQAGPDADRVAWIYLLPALLLLVWTFRLAAAERPYAFIDFVNLAFHESGHLVFSPFGRTLHILGGTLLQLIIPGFLVGYFLNKRRRFSAAVCAWWFGENFINISVYMADARDLKLDLVGGGDHDWNNLFYQFGLLGEGSVATVSSLTHHTGVLIMLATTVWIACFALPRHVREDLGERVTGRFPALQFLFE